MKIQPRSILILLTFLCLTAPKVFAVVPPPGGCYPGFTTAEGCDALNSLTTGAANTALGWRSLFLNTIGSFNTGVGAGTLVLNTADSNTAVGAAALLLNTTGTENTAIGTAALVHNDTAEQNTAMGAFALSSHVSGNANTAFGANALVSDATGQFNTAVGYGALFSNVGGPFPGSFNTAVGATALANNTGGDNTATGTNALVDNTTGNDNTADGLNALLRNTNGSNNVALGRDAGQFATTGSDNVYIGASMGGTAGESNSCYIASIFGQTSASGATVLINSNNKVGTMTSSKRFKEDIKPMDKASEAIFALRPVAFRYKKEIDSAGTPQLGLVAEEVERVNPSLVVRDKDRKPYSVRYDQVNAMLLNEFLKEHTAFLEEQCKVEDQQKEIDALKAELREQRALIQKVSDSVEMKRSAPQVASNR